MAIARYGIKQLLPESIRLISGPGCPVCVTPVSTVDAVVQMVQKYQIILCTFGDMFRVPGNTSSLEIARRDGADIRIVASTLEAIEIAVQNPTKDVVFLGVGFETTAPTVASSVLMAKEKKLKNYFVYSAHKTMPQALHVLCESDSKVSGFLLPGHVSTIIGTTAYQFLPNDFQKACVVAGFEATDILSSIYALLRQIRDVTPKVEIQYTRAVQSIGNTDALKVLYHVFEESDSVWRGIGTIPKSGLAVRSEYADFDAGLKFPVQIDKTVIDTKCRCGDILTGKIDPEDCPYFGGKCTPDHPVGPCMVSQEGTCAARYQY